MDEDANLLRLFFATPFCGVFSVFKCQEGSLKEARAVFIQPARRLIEQIWFRWDELLTEYSVNVAFCKALRQLMGPKAFHPHRRRSAESPKSWLDVKAL